MRLHALLTLAAPLLGALAGAHARVFTGSAMEGMEEAANFQIQHRLEMARGFLGPPQAEEPAAHQKREPIMTFRNPKARQFHVDGTKIPDGASLAWCAAARCSCACSGVRCGRLVGGVDAHLG